jgi:hypothetical protein
MKDLKGPNQQPSDANRGKQTEEPSRQYIDLATGQIYSDGFEPLPNAATEDPGVRIVSTRLGNTSAKPSGIGTQKQT